MAARNTSHPFKISVSDRSLQQLKQKLELTTIADDQEYINEEEAWSHGPPASDLRRLVEYWKTGFDWRAVEERLNSQLQMFTTTIDVDGFESMNVHFVHHKSEKCSGKSIPLLFIHGWPGSFLEVSKLIKDLTSPDDRDPNHPVFDVVAPSLPNFGFSSEVKKRGFGLDQYAESCHKLMLKLGYDGYVTQSGDLGFRIARTIGIRYPDSCKASHINMLRADPPRALCQPLTWLQYMITPYTKRDKEGFERSRWFLNQGSGYRILQATKPQTIGYSLSDSPLALLSWIYEKLHDWSDQYTWTDDEILTWVSIYWHSTAGPIAAQRIYYEMVNAKGTTITDTERYVPHVKLGLAHFPRELIVIPTLWCRTLGPVVYEKEHSRGGHFAAYEKPEAIVSDLRAMFGRGGKAFSVVTGRDGYAA
ncbi:hypothetical protein LZ554_008869 [Drepanopeziza brunnea f. sp. 'monogermtubi']|nr:hypothetical protein LZ554_008869 [Drepanopeziza brunnea f. sp. 'monogermtubi']